MPAIYVPWDKQPPVGTLPDWANPITKGMYQWAVAEGAPRDPFKCDNTGGFLVTQESVGRAVKLVSASNQYYITLTTPPKATNPNNVTAIAVYRPDSLATQQGIFIHWGSASIYNRLMLTTGGVLTAESQNSGTVTATGPVTLSAGNWYVVGGRFVGGVHRTAWVNGVSGAAGTTSKLVTGNNGIAWNSAVSTERGNATYAARLAWSRGLTDREMRLLGLNPWQVYQPRRTWLWTPIAAAGVATTITPGTGAVVLAGSSPTLTVSDNKNTTPAVGTVSYTGYSPSLYRSQLITPGVGAVSYAGYAPTVSVGINPVPGVGSVVYAGYAPSLYRSQLITPTTGVVNYAGYAPSPNQVITIAPYTGAINLTGYAPSLATLGVSNIVPNTGTVNFAGSSPSIYKSVLITPSTGVVSLTGYVPTVSQVVSRAPSTGTVNLAGYAPALYRSVLLTPSIGTITFAGLAPTVSTPVTGTVTPSVGSVSLAGYAPTVTSTTTRTITPSVGAVALAGYAPQVQLTTTQILAATEGQILLSGYAPTVEERLAGTILTGTGSINFTGYSPTVAFGKIVHTATGTLAGPGAQLIGYASIGLTRVIAQPTRVALELKRLADTKQIAFDFLSQMAQGESLVSATNTVLVYSGNDPAPSLAFTGTSNIVGSQAVQLAAGGVSGCTYQIECQGLTSFGRKTFLSSFLVVL